MIHGDEHLARGLLHIAQQRLLHDHPYHARFIARWELQSAAALRTMGVTIRDGGIALLFNPGFVNSCSPAELGGVLLHEVHHILLGHLTLDPRRFPDAEALLIAEETAANQFVCAPLPGNPILLSQYPGLPSDDDTERRYGRLARKRRDQQRAALYQKSLPAGPDSISADQEMRDQVPNSAELHTLDDHEIWSEARQLGITGALTVRVELQETAAALSHDEWTRVPDDFREQIAKQAGHGSGTGVEHLIGTGSTSVRWGLLLDRYVRAATEYRPTLNRPPRRFPNLVGIVPGRRQQSSRARVMTVIDSSSSMDSRTLEQVSAELSKICRVHAVTVVECDTEIRRTYPFNGRLDTIHGRGGTDLRPAFNEDLLKQVRPGLIAYFTDGFGPAPDRPPRIPTVWCIVSGGRVPVEWGRRIWLPDRKFG